MTLFFVEDLEISTRVQASFLYKVPHRLQQIPGLIYFVLYATQDVQPILIFLN